MQEHRTSEQMSDGVAISSTTIQGAMVNGVLETCNPAPCVAQIAEDRRQKRPRARTWLATTAGSSGGVGAHPPRRLLARRFPEPAPQVARNVARTSPRAGQHRDATSVDLREHYMSQHGVQAEDALRILRRWMDRWAVDAKRRSRALSRSFSGRGRSNLRRLSYGRCATLVAPRIDFSIAPADATSA